MSSFRGCNPIGGRRRRDLQPTRPAMNSVDRRGQGSASSSNSLQASPGYIGAGFIAPDTTFLDGRTQHPAQTTAPGNAPYGPFANGPSPAFTGRVAHQPFGAQEELGLFQSISYYTVQTPVTQPHQQVGWVNENISWEPSGQLATVGRVNYEMVPNNVADPVNEGSFNFSPYSPPEDTMAEQHVDPHSGLLHVAGQYEFSGSLTSEPGGSQMGNLQPRISDTASGSSMSLQPDEYVDLSHDQYNQTENQSFPMNYLEEPWSTTNMRSVEHVYSSLSPGTLEPIGSFATSMSASTSHGSEEDGSSVPRYDHATSQATFDSEVDGMVESWATIREGGENSGSINPMPMNDRSPLHGLSSTYDQVLDTQVGIRFQLRIRGDTPSLMAGVEGDVDRAVQDMDTIVYVDPRGSLSVPAPESPCSDAPSTPSQISVTPSSVAAVVYCNEDNCNAEFTGKFRRGNLARHKRRKHRGMPGDYPCEDHHCGRFFNRSDARLNHYRKHHAHLVVGPMVPRGPRGSSRAHP